MVVNQSFEGSGSICAFSSSSTINARSARICFNTDRVIKNFINKDATAETMARWLLGASAMGANREAGAIIGRMKEVLGDNHPAIQGVRTDFLFEVVSPLLHPDGPNFNQFIRNYELMIERNPTLVKELNLNMGDFKELHDLSRLLWQFHVRLSTEM